MFTGIVEAAGRVARLTPTDSGVTLDVEVPFSGEVSLGESVAVNGACLTVTMIGDGNIAFDLLEETLRVTNLGDLKEGDEVNLERSLRVGDRLSGHFVQGHVDACVSILCLEKSEQDVRFEIELPENFKHLTVHKGSICVNGISLTIAELLDDRITIWIIPHTLEVTNLKSLSQDDRVNLEFDMLAKHIARLRDLA